MSEPGEDTDVRIQRLRALAERVIGRIGGLPAVATLAATLEAYDRAVGPAAGAAYAALIALLPALLLALSVIGLVVSDPAVREQIVDLIATAVPPLEDLVRVALEQVSAGAVPTSIVAIVGLLWGSSRFYAALDYALSRVFHKAPRRNEVVRTLRGLLLVALFIAVPIIAVVVGSVVTGHRSAWSSASSGGSARSWRRSSCSSAP
jgi:membrane protein